jgi:cellulose biosynthesis protein BcsQ
VIVISLCSLKGGVGKTSVVLGLASAALARGLPTLVVDLDPQADATLALDVRSPTEDGPDDDVATVLGAARRGHGAVTVTPSGWSDGERGRVDVLAGSPEAADLDRPGGEERTVARLSQRLSQALAGLDDYRLVLVDCPPSLGALTRAGLAASHRAVVVTEPALFSVSAADRALRAVDELRNGPAPGLQPMGVLVNRFRLRSPEHRYRLGELSDMFGPLVLSPPIPERSAVQQAQGASQPVHHWPGTAARELAETFDTHLARIQRVASRASRQREPAKV